MAFVQGVSSNGSAGTSPQAAPAFGTSVAVGDLIVVLAGGDGGQTGDATGVTDSLGNTYTRVPSFDFANTGGTLNMDAWYSVATHAGASNVVSLAFNAANENCVLVVQHFNGFVGTATLDQKHTSSNATGTSSTSGATGTLAHATSLIVGLHIHDSTVSAFTLGTGYTNLTTVSIAARQAGMQSKVVAATTAVTSLMTIAATRINMGGVLVFFDGSGVTTTRTITGVSNISATTTRTITGKANIQGLPQVQFENFKRAKTGDGMSVSESGAFN